jgi:hypothetical protein
MGRYESVPSAAHSVHHVNQSLKGSLMTWSRTVDKVLYKYRCAVGQKYCQSDKQQEYPESLPVLLSHPYEYGKIKRNPHQFHAEKVHYSGHQNGDCGDEI